MISYEGEALLLAKVAKVLCTKIANFKGFDGSFPSGCQQESVPSTLKTFVSMLLNGVDLKDQNSDHFFNFNNKFTSSTAKSRHSLNREPPLPLYIGMKIHTETRSKNLITQLYNFGLSVSYYRVLQLENQLTNAVCKDYYSKGTVVPPRLRHRLFTVGALDNLDHNPSSSTAKGSFHGTGISLFQFPMAENLGDRQADIMLHPVDNEKNHQLPDSYTTVPAVALKTASASVLQLLGVSVPKKGQLVSAQLNEKSWLKHASKLLDKKEIETGHNVSWSAYHASLQQHLSPNLTTQTQFLPLFL